MLTRSRLRTTSFMPSLCLTGRSKIKFIIIANRKGYINSEDLKEVFKLLGETVTDEEVNSKDEEF